MFHSKLHTIALLSALACASAPSQEKPTRRQTVAEPPRAAAESPVFPLDTRGAPPIEATMTFVGAAPVRYALDLSDPADPTFAPASGTATGFTLDAYPDPATVRLEWRMPPGPRDGQVTLNMAPGWRVPFGPSNFAPGERGVSTGTVGRPLGYTIGPFYAEIVSRNVSTGEVSVWRSAPFLLLGNGIKDESHLLRYAARHHVWVWPGRSSPTFVLARDLTLGSRGADVARLQGFLEAKGFLILPAGVPKGYFGPLLKSALAKWQRVRGIQPDAGFCGPITRAAINAELSAFP